MSFAVEKRLKASIVQRIQEPAPYTHDLRRLALVAGLKLDDQQQDQLDTLSTFNIAARYPDEQERFTKKFGNKKTATEYLIIAKSFFLWLEGSQKK